MNIEEGLPDNPMDEPVADRVAWGVALLDEKGPEGWRTRVNPDTLDLTSDYVCVLGLVYGSFREGMMVLGLSGHATAARYGFAAITRGGWGDVFVTEKTPEILELESEWRRVLTAEPADASAA